MIKYTNNKNDIIKCWKEAFGDSDEDILFFIDNAKDAKCLAFYENDKITSMLYLVDSSLGKYIYAACTLKKYQGKGYMSQLLEYCKYNFKKVSLIPANVGLIKYYEDRGLTVREDIETLIFNQIDEINEYLFEGCELEHPFIMSYERMN